MFPTMSLPRLLRLGIEQSQASQAPCLRSPCHLSATVPKATASRQSTHSRPASRAYSAIPSATVTCSGVRRGPAVRLGNVCQSNGPLSVSGHSRKTSSLSNTAKTIRKTTSRVDTTSSKSQTIARTASTGSATSAQSKARPLSTGLQGGNVKSTNRTTVHTVLKKTATAPAGAQATPLTSEPSPLTPTVRTDAVRTAEAREAALRAARLRRQAQRVDLADEEAKKAEAKKEYQKKYKTAARKWTSTIIALPILLVTSYYLFGRRKSSSSYESSPRSASY